MPYRLKRKESVDQGLKRVALEQLQRAQQECEDRDLDSDTKVHQIRKRMKKLRALLRLAKDRLGDKNFRSGNHRARSLARRLAGDRDAQVMLDTANALAGDDPVLAGAGLEQVQTQLQTQVGHHAQRSELGLRLQQSRQELIEMQNEVTEWPLRGKGLSAIESGLRRTYKRGRKALKKVGRDANDEDMHTWRKRVKDYWYHVRLLENAWPGLMTCQADELKILSELLGDHNDLSVLETTLVQLPREVIGDEQKDVWKSQIGREKRRLRRHAMLLGRRIYTEPAGRLIDRIDGYWDVWKGHR